MYPSAHSLGLTVVRTTGNEEQVLCPFHSDRRPSASYNRKKGLFNCYVCNLGLNILQLSKRLGLGIAGLEEWENISQEPEDYNLVSDTPTIYLGDMVYHEYFEERRISSATAFAYNLRWNYNPPQAAVLPIPTLQGNFVGALYRYKDPKEAGTRYRILGSAMPVWPMNFLRRVTRTILITEGAWSAMRIHSWYLEQKKLPPLCLALLGAKANMAIVALLQPFDRKVFLYDGDKAGVNACRKMRKLAPLYPTYTVSTSPDDMSDEQIGELVVRLEDKGLL